MTNYVVSWTEETWYRVNIQADSEEQAREKFWEFDFDQEESKQFGEEVQDSIEIWEALWTGRSIATAIYVTMRQAQS